MIQWASSLRTLIRAVPVAIILAGCQRDSDEGISIGSFGSSVAPLELLTVMNGSALDVGHIGAVVADGEGRMYVLDTHPSSTGVVVLDAEGEISNRIGRPGQGPGELSDVRHALSWQGDTLLVLDSGSRRITGFDREGQLVSSVTWPQSRRLYPQILLGGRKSIYGLETRVLVPSRNDVPEPVVEVEYVQLVPGGSTRPLPALHERVVGQRGVDCPAADGQRIYLLTVPFRDPLAFRGVLSDGRLVKAHPERFQVDFVDPESGDTVQSFSRDVPRRPIHDEDWSTTAEGMWLQQYEAEGGGPLGSLNDRSAPCEVYSLLPEQAPAIRALRVDEEDRLWVERSGERPGEVIATIMDADGYVVGEVMMPERDGRVAPYVRGQRLYLVNVDEFGMQSISVFEVPLTR